MADADRQENTTRRVRVEDADYVLSSEDPNMPRVREDDPAPAGALRALVMLCAVLLVLTALLLAARRSPPASGPAELRFAAVRTVPERSAFRGGVLGLEVEDISEPVAAYYRTKGREIVAGVGVFAADPEGPVAELLPGDVITAVNGTEISSAAELALLAEETDGPLTLTVYRDGGYREVRTGPGR